MSIIPEYNENGQQRRVGVEIELIGLEVNAIAQLVQNTFGGSLNKETDYEIKVNSDRLGTFRIEVDLALLKEMGQQRKESEDAPGFIDQVSENILASVADKIAPCEIVTAPIPFDAITELDRLVTVLNSAGAKGTEESLMYAFGVHFNPEAPSLQADSLLAYLRSFILLYDWLKERLKIDISRRISPFVNAFPSSYAELILLPSYTPDVTRLIDDYLTHNPTRNRALDMLPLFAHINESQIKEALDDPLVTSRPTYHYRLPNSRLGDPEWRVSDEWQSWLTVERLAQQPEVLRAMAGDYLSMTVNPTTLLTSQWLQRSRGWLDAIYSR